jgi:hypothetical protein
MPYLIYNNDGTVLVTLSDQQVDSVTTSLDLIGKNLNNYGQYFNNNLVKLLTNFASEDEPRSPQIGQLWYNKTSDKLTVFNGVYFTSAYGTHVAGTQPLTTSTGDLWYDTINSQLLIWNGTSYKLIAPANSGLYGKFGIEKTPTTVLTDGTNIPKNVSLIYSFGSNVGLITTSSFTMSTASSSLYLGVNNPTSVVDGITLLNDIDIKGDLYLQGNIKTPLSFLTTTYDITPYGDTQDAVASTSTRQTRITDGNNAIRFDMRKLFPVETISTLSQYSYALGSELRVLCNYNTTISVRRFILDDRLGPYDWEPYDLYYNTWTTVHNNIVI